MSDKNFDKEISLLYQQRKQEINAPEVYLSEVKVIKTKRYNALQIIAIFFFGGAASFGILAFMNHLIEQKVAEALIEPKMLIRVVELTEPSEDIIIIKPALAGAKKPSKIPLRREQHELLDKQTIATDLAVGLPFDDVNIIPSGSTAQPILSLVPLYQELAASSTTDEVQVVFRAKAVYPRQARRDNIEGWVQLAFDINETGKVENVSVIASEPKRIFNKAARKALLKWKYQVLLVDGKPLVHKNRSIQLNFKMEFEKND
jgi:protein TonB